MKGFVFDLDNTLYDRYATIAKFMTLDWERIKKYVNPAYNLERAIDHVIHTEPLFVIDGWQPVYEHLVAEHFFNADNIPCLEKFCDFGVEWFKKVAEPYPYTKNVLNVLKMRGYKLGVITASGKDWRRQYTKLELLGIRDMFDFIVVSGEYAEKMCGDPDNQLYSKPYACIFEYAARQLGVEPKDLYYVGDNAKNDVVGARNGGYTPIWIRSRSPWLLDNELIPELCFDTIEGILSVV